MSPVTRDLIEVGFEAEKSSDLNKRSRGRRIIEVMRSVSARGLIEVTLKNDGYKNRDFMRPENEQ